MTDWLQTGSRASGQDWITGLYQQRDRQQAGRQLAAGDPRAAANTLYAGGDLQGGRVLASDARETANAERGAQAQATLRITRALREAKEQGRDIIATYDAFRPQIMQTGVDENQFMQLRQLLSSDPNALDTVERLAGAEADKYETREINGDLVRVNERTGAVSTLIDNPDRPIVTPYGILLPPSAGSAAGSGGQPAPLTGSAISAAPIAGAAPAAGGGRLWDRQENQESGGRQFGSNGRVLTSPAGAFGVAQLMPGTAAELAPRLGVTPEQLRTSPELNRRAGQLYMDDQLAKYGGNEALALAAYNAGPGRVDEWIQRFGDPRTGEITTEEFVSRIPFAETKAYVGNIMAGSGEVAQGDQDAAPSGLRPVGGGWNLQQMETPAEARALRSEQRAERREERLDRRAETQDERAARETAAAASARTFTQENQLRGQLGQNQAIKDLAAVRPQVGIIGDIASRAARGEQISAQDDLALIFSFMKILDPGSVVREGEFANAQNTAGIPDRVVNAYNNALRGTRLSDGQRNEFFRTATRAISQYDQAALAAIERTRTTTQAYGLNPDRVAPLPPRRERTETPRLRFQPTEAQTQLSSEIVRSRPSQGRRGERTNPILINPSDPTGSYGNVPRGAYFITPDGQLRGPKP